MGKIFLTLSRTSLYHLGSILPPLGMHSVTRNYEFSLKKKREEKEVNEEEGREGGRLAGRGDGKKENKQVSKQKVVLNFPVATPFLAI